MQKTRSDLTGSLANSIGDYLDYNDELSEMVLRHITDVVNDFTNPIDEAMTTPSTPANMSNTPGLVRQSFKG